METTIRRLGDAELEIMLAVWSAGESVPSAFVQEKLRSTRDWALPAVITSLNRLVDKGFLSCEKRGRSNFYTPLIAEADYKAAEGRGVLDRLYGGSFKGLAAALFESRSIDKKDLEDLRRYLDELEGK